MKAFIIHTTIIRFIQDANDNNNFINVTHTLTTRTKRLNDDKLIIKLPQSSKKSLTPSVPLLLVRAPKRTCNTQTKDSNHNCRGK